MKRNNELLEKKKPTGVSTVTLVCVRTFTVMFLLSSAILLHICVIFRPWKEERIENSSIRLSISIWHVCRGTKCYEGVLADAPAWFLVFRWFLMMSIFIQYFCVLFSICTILMTKNSGKRYFWVPAFFSLLSAVLILTAMLLLIGYREFDFLENIRMYRMGWRSRMHHNDIWRWPFYVTWCSFVICLFSFVTSMFANSIELKFAANCGYKTKCLSKK